MKCRVVITAEDERDGVVEQGAAQRRVQQHVLGDRVGLLSFGVH